MMRFLTTARPTRTHAVVNNSSNNRATPVIVKLSRNILRLSAGIAALMLASTGFESQSAQAQQTPLGCGAPFAVVQTFDEGSKWEVCWGYGTNRGVYFYNFYYTPREGKRTKVIADGWISQIHVAYDNNEARFHDVSGDMLGLGGDYLRGLFPSECEGGEIRYHLEKGILCMRLSQQAFGYTAKMAESSGRVRQEGSYLDLFSASQTGHYSYIPTWRLFSDGTIELIMGATGKLERVKTESLCDEFDNTCDNLAEEAWPLNDQDYYGVSHTHNYFWRLDFDLGIDDGQTNMNTVGADDIIEQVEFVTDSTGKRRQKVVTRVTNEAALDTNPNRMRSWRLRDPSIKNRNGNDMAWYIEPSNNGHRFDGADKGGTPDIQEEFQRGDMFVTAYKGCERFASFNNVNDDNADCAEFLKQTDINGNEIGFVNGESIVGNDQVVYLKLSFHHTPRNEDEPHMHSHWNSIKIVPRNVHNVNPIANKTDTIALTPGVANTSWFGHNYARGQHFNRLALSFVDTGQDMALTFESFDMDTPNELVVRLNGRTVGWSRDGRNNAKNARKTMIYLPREMQVNPTGSGDQNIIEIRQRRLGQRWGVGNLMIRPPLGNAISLATGPADSTSYGWRYGQNQHRDILPIEVNGDGTSKTLSLRGYDMDQTREALIFVNGRVRHFLKAGPDRGLTGTQTFTLNANDLNLATNRVVIVQSQPGDSWGATDLRLTP